MDPFSLTVGSLAILEECLKYGKLLVKLYNDYQKAEHEVSETLLKLKVIWLQTETQMIILSKIWHTLPSDYQQTQLSLLCVLENKLQRACRLLEDIIGTTSDPGGGGLDAVLRKKGPLSRIKYVSIKKDLDGSVVELIEWRQLFNDLWYLLARAPGSEVDQSLGFHPKDAAVELLTSLRKSVKDLSSEDNTSSREVSSYDFLESRAEITASCATIAQFEDRMEYAIVDTMIMDPKLDAAGTTRSVRALTKALSRTKPITFGLLRCCGVINKTVKYEFVFEIPKGLNHKPRSLRDLLSDHPPPLNIKLDIAKQLANSVFHLHAIGFVHKNIRPDSTLVFDRGQEKVVFLVGFENYRTVKDETFFNSDKRPERELYRHPSRQGSNINRRYVMQHDIYSLGICLLEIGLWKTFVSIGQHETVLDFNIDTHISDATKRANAIKKKLLIMVSEQLSQHVGIKFRNVVERCMTWLDKEGINATGTPEVDVGLEFIETVLTPLREIVV